MEGGIRSPGQLGSLFSRRLILGCYHVPGGDPFQSTLFFSATPSTETRQQDSKAWSHGHKELECIWIAVGIEMTSRNILIWNLACPAHPHPHPRPRPDLDRDPDPDPDPDTYPYPPTPPDAVDAVLEVLNTLPRTNSHHRSKRAYSP